jgi:hypothetical protein
MAYVKAPWLDAIYTPEVTDPEEVSGERTFALQVAASGTGWASQVVLEGSVDGVNWSALVTVTGQSGPAIGWAVDKPVQFIRLNVNNFDTGAGRTLNASVIAV